MATMTSSSLANELLMMSSSSTQAEAGAAGVFEASNSPWYTSKTLSLDNELDDFLLQEIVSKFGSPPPPQASTASTAAPPPVPSRTAPVVAPSLLPPMAPVLTATTAAAVDEETSLPCPQVKITGTLGVPNPLEGFDYYTPVTTVATATAAVVSQEPVFKKMKKETFDLEGASSHSMKETIELEASRVVEELLSTSSMMMQDLNTVVNNENNNIVVVDAGVVVPTTLPAPSSNTTEHINYNYSNSNNNNCSAASVVSTESSFQQEVSSETSSSSSVNNKKRKRCSSSSLSSASTATSAATTSSSSNEPLDEEAKKERNRYHARKSRQRKKTLTDTLKMSLEVLKEENALLKSQIYQIIGQKQCQERLEQRRIDSHNKFIEALKQPQNRRIVKRDTLKFLAGLRTKLPTSSTSKESSAVSVPPAAVSSSTKVKEEPQEDEGTMLQVIA